MARIRGKLTYANVVATLALFLALSGSAVYAANTINGKTVKKGTLPGNRLKQGSVTGTQVDEASLGTVPLAQSAKSAESASSAESAQSAQSAQSATSALSAQSVGGVSEQLVRASRPDTAGSFTSVATIDGLVINMACIPGEADVQFTGSIAGDNGSHAVVIDEATSPTSFDFFFGQTASVNTSGAASFLSGSATMRRSSGRVVRFDFQLHEVPNGFGTSDDCFLSGFVRSAP